jgi:biopolymer transport protein ExbD
MRIKKGGHRIYEGEMTPMIDMTFQLIAFFMVLINFSQTEQHERILLPSAALAKPPDSPIETPITLHVTRTGSVIIGIQEVELLGLPPHLANETSALTLRNRTPADATIIVRAHKDVATGRVQDVIRVCQENRFERFILRVKEEVGY